MSSQEIGYLPENLFDDVTSGELSSGDTEYRCYYSRNSDDTDNLTGPRVYFFMNTPSPDTTFGMGLDPAGVGNGITTGVAVTIVNESTAPIGVVFSNPIDFASGLVIGDLTPGNGQAIWLRRVVTGGGTALPWDAVRIRLEGEV